MPAAAVAALIAVGAGAGAARAQTAAAAEAWLSDLQADVAADLAAGRPLVVEAHVPLCDSDVLRCGGGRLGDGDDPDGNLYWATSGGFRGWFGRRGSGWTQVLLRRDPQPDVLELRVWRRWVTPTARMRARGVRRRIPVYVVAHAWRGEAIGSAMAAYAADLFAGPGAARRIALPDGTELEAGGGARVVAFVGHNGWMGVDGLAFRWPKPAPKAPRRGAIAVACLTEAFLVPAVPSSARVPLLFTRSLLFAGAHAFEGAVVAFAQGATLGGIRDGAAHAYAAGQDRPFARARAAFTNPADVHWKNR
ncbi:MAG TPA: hypothetical protein VKB80_37390 [Kofleriaceae bacterium]|nr:hypothetical protein [Kofleriaceae bacterium]